MGHDIVLAITREFRVLRNPIPVPSACLSRSQEPYLQADVMNWLRDQCVSTWELLRTTGHICVDLYASSRGERPETQGERHIEEFIIDFEDHRDAVNFSLRWRGLKEVE
jgi:hypothetical protein